MNTLPENLIQTVALHYSGATVLPKELSRYVSTERLARNALRYFAELGELTELQEKRVEKIKNVLADIPLTHASRHEEVLSGQNDILPFSDLPEGHRGNSLESDRSLGLTQCVFFGWGLGEKSRYGRSILQISPDLLDLDTTFVTPVDFGHIEFADDRPYDDYEPKRKANIEKEYFDKMVSGKAWKEIIARRILRQVESGEPFLKLHTLYSLGEIKHFGAVPKEYITGSFSTGDLRGHYRFLYEHGFSFSNMEDKRNFFLRSGQRTGVDPMPEECGIDYERARCFWKETLGL